MTESRDGDGSGDHDQPFRFGNPKTMLNPREQARLMIFKATAAREVERRKLLEKLKGDRNLRMG